MSFQIHHVQEKKTLWIDKNDKKGLKLCLDLRFKISAQKFLSDSVKKRPNHFEKD